jgi:hypothetical protein
MIFKKLDRVTSTCLGLTKKDFYLLHKERHRIVPLTACCLLPPNRESGRILFGLLKGWMKEAGLVFSKTELKFTTRERLAEMKEQDLSWRIARWRAFSPGQSPLQKRLTQANHTRRMEVLRDEREAGGWWDNGVWVDGLESGKGEDRWFELDFEDIDEVESCAWF